ncbi:MAG: ABC transporter substrate-binding protein, partial [Candidatus Kariarchaeaceae archaeon]
MKSTVLILCMLLTLSQAVYAEEGDPNPVFYLTLMAPNTSAGTNIAPVLLRDTLPQIGIGVTDLLSAGWDMIAPRTFAHPREGNAHNGVGSIPIFDEGGYDLVFIGLSESLDYNPAPSYSNLQFSPDGTNFASYDNQTVSDLINQYSYELDVTNRLDLAKQIQAIVYADQPYINLAHPATLWPFHDDLEVDDGTLLLLNLGQLGAGWQDMNHLSKSEVLYAHAYETAEFLPLLQSSYISQQYLRIVYPGLYVRDPQDQYFSYQPLIAKSMPVFQDNNQVITIELNPEATFSDGSTVSVEDVVNSFNLYLDPDISYPASEYPPYFRDTIVQATDSTHIQLTLNQPADFRILGMIATVPIMKQAQVGIPADYLANSSLLEDFNSRPWNFSGAGPFQFTADGFEFAGTYTKYAKQMVLHKVENYWNGEVNLDTIEFRYYEYKDPALPYLQDGTIDIADGQFWWWESDVEAISRVAYMMIPDLTTRFISVNMDHPI